MFKLPFM